MGKSFRQVVMGLFVLLLLLPACVSQSTGAPTLLRLATTTSTADSGLLDTILPDFEQQYGARVEVIAVGTGQAIALGEKGDVDVILVHARAKEDDFIEAGHGVNRQDVMYNDFVLVGPESDPAAIQPFTRAAEAMATIAIHGQPFVSRGDDSGTHTKEQSLWAEMNLTPTAELSWYKSLGQGMGETLITANELGAYTLADRGTFLSMQERLPALQILVGGATIADNQDPMLRNPYGIIAVNPANHPGINTRAADLFITWIISPETQAKISDFGREKFGQPLFYPAHP